VLCCVGVEHGAAVLALEAQLACREGADGELKFYASAGARMPVRAPPAEASQAQGSCSRRLTAMRLTGQETGVFTGVAAAGSGAHAECIFCFGTLHPDSAAGLYARMYYNTLNKTWASRQVSPSSLCHRHAAARGAGRRSGMPDSGLTSDVKPPACSGQLRRCSLRCTRAARAA